MGDVTKRLAAVRATNERIAKISAQGEAARRKRDEQIRAAFADGATWEQLEGTGVSRATIQKAKNARSSRA